MKKNFFMLLAAAALVSCSTSEMNEPDAISGSLISLKSTTSATDGTRTPFIGDVSATNPLTALVPSTITDGNYTSLHAEGTMTFNNSNKNIASTYNAASLTNPTVEAAFPAGNQVYLFGLHPSSGWVANALPTTGYTLTFTGKEDVMGSQQELVKKSEVNKSEYRTLTFKHLLTKLEVKFMAEASAIAVAGQIRHVEWIGNAAVTEFLKNKVTYTPTASPAETRAKFDTEAAATAKKELSFYGATVTSGVIAYTDAAYENQTYVLTTAPTLQAYAMVTPVGATKLVEDEYYIRVTREFSDGTSTKDIIPIDLMQADNINPFTEHTAGNAFSVVVNYTKEEIKAVATVIDWAENGEYVANIPAK